ncbi:hypothetical protein, conserved [Eimeria tenella]|uniref:Uncharacterized protein n=1 Tax=Eimeria tenella TaxID=5802 RepID=U6KLC6_EIMTE|nr:hypothetical protein, conserved [Eimeria tenella]CDJ38902.1 hypothetical protein, conserved [Eimeria tenella]|eukprot:XP_013229657.1 hypothetical protein, conserved [Eimeria tenella]
MWPLSESQGRFGQLVVLALWVMPTEGMSTQNTQLHSQHLGKDSNGLQRYTKLQGYGDTSLSTVGSFALYYTPAEEPITSGHKHELEKHDNEEFSGVQLASSRSVQPEAQNQIDDILHNVRTFISKTTLKNRFLVISSYYKLYSLFRACAVAYGLGFLFSNVNQIAGLANIVVGTLTSLFLNRWMHNVYAGIISGANLPDKVENSLSTFIRNDRKRIDSFTHSSIIASIKEAMMTSVRSALNPQSLGDTIDRALVPLGPSGPQLMNFSTETISMDEFKTKYPFVFLLRHVETPVHAFTTGKRPGLRHGPPSSLQLALAYTVRQWRSAAVL